MKTSDLLITAKGIVQLKYANDHTCITPTDAREVAENPTLPFIHVLSWARRRMIDLNLLRF